MKIQSRLKKGARRKMPAHLAREIESAVIRDSMRWNCSKSWIIATALAAFYDIDIMLPYVIKKKKKAA